jgi:drug/metabolite transporter (DMT)-like permease
VGVLGVALPVVLSIEGFVLCRCGSVQASISDYYSLRTRDVLVGTLFAVGWFLFTYHGYDRRDDIAGNLACVFALGIALFPNSGGPLEQRVHFISATAFFAVLSYFSIVLFTKTAGHPTAMKRARNVVYRVCGGVMLACIVFIAIYFLFLQQTAVSRVKPVFWLESTALWAFGWSWFVKGETLLKDPEP